jgi:hypothetical protein
MKINNPPQSSGQINSTLVLRKVPTYLNRPAVIRQHFLDLGQIVIHEPVCLPCGETVCRSHSEDICSGKCPFCPKTHKLQDGGFPPNLMVQNMLMNKLHTLKMNCDKFGESYGEHRRHLHYVHRYYTSGLGPESGVKRAHKLKVCIYFFT